MWSECCRWVKRIDAPRKFKGRVVALKIGAAEFCGDLWPKHSLGSRHLARHDTRGYFECAICSDAASHLWGVIT